MQLELTDKEVKALKRALDVLDDMPSSIGDFGVDQYSYDCARAKLAKEKLPDKTDYE